MDAFTWFKRMISFPNEEKLTKTALFTQWTALLAYGGGGVALLCAPSLWGILLAFDVQQRTQGYLRLIGVYLIALSFIYIIVARSGSCTLKHGPTLSSILERLILVNGVLIMFIFRDILPLYFAIVFIILDTAISVISLCIWIKETTNASFVLYFKEVFGSFETFLYFSKSTITSISVQIIGLLQFCGGVIPVVAPHLIQHALDLSPFQYHAGGFLACVFLLIVIHGWFHVMAGCAELPAFSTAALFYRLSFTLPLLCILYSCDQIELYLFILLGSIEFGFALILLFSTLIQNNQSKTRVQVFDSQRETHEERKHENPAIDNIEDIMT